MCVKKSLDNLFSIGNCTWEEKYSYSLKLGQPHENVSSKFCIRGIFHTALYAVHSKPGWFLALCMEKCKILRHDKHHFNIYVSSKLQGKHSRGGHDFSNYKQRGVRKTHTGIKGGHSISHTTRLELSSPPSLISNEQCLMHLVIKIIEKFNLKIKLIETKT